MLFSHNYVQVASQYDPHDLLTIIELFSRISDNFNCVPSLLASLVLKEE